MGSLIQNKLGLAIIGALLLMLVAALAGVVYGGPLDPPGAPASTQENLIFQPTNGCAGFPFNLTAPGVYKLASDIAVPSGCGQTGFYVDANITLDLNGYTVHGVPGTMAGVVLFGADSVVKNGTITGFAQAGINVSGESARIENVSVTHNGGAGLIVANGGKGALVTNVIASFNVGGGIYVGVQGAVVTNCNAYNNASAGIWVERGTVTNCTAATNAGRGFIIVDSALSDCTATGNTGALGAGIVGNGAVTNCEVSTNAQEGILTTASSSSIQGSNIHDNGSDGIKGINMEVLDNSVYNNTGAGIRASSSGNRIDSNNVVSNAAGGIIVSGTTNTIVRNSVTGGTPYTIGAGNTSGPITGPGVVPTNPWGNITY